MNRIKRYFPKKPISPAVFTFLLIVIIGIGLLLSTSEARAAAGDIQVNFKDEFGNPFTPSGATIGYCCDGTEQTTSSIATSSYTFTPAAGADCDTDNEAITINITDVGSNGYLKDIISSTWSSSSDPNTYNSANQFTVLVNLTNEFGTAVTGGGNEIATFNPSPIFTQATSSAQWLGRAIHTSVVYDDKMWVMGGYDGNYKNDVWYSTDGITWTQATSSAQWSARYAHTSLVYDNKMWVIGGVDGTYKNDVWYSTDGITWTQATSSAQWLGRRDHTSVVYDNKMWVVGGNAGTRKNDVWHSTDGITWVQATSSAQWSARTDHTSLVYDNKMWVIGGSLGGFPGTYKNDAWCSTDGITWTQATSSAQWSARYDHTSLVYDNKMWVIGGADGVIGYKNDVWHSTDGITWVQATSSAQWSTRYSHTSLVYDNKMWVIGGSDGTYKNDVWYSFLSSVTDSEKSDNTQIGIPVPTGTGIGSVRVAGLGEEGYLRNDISSVSVPAAEVDSQTTINSANSFTVMVTFQNELGTAITGDGDEAAIWDSYGAEEKSDNTKIGIKVPAGIAASNVVVSGLGDQGYLDYTIVNSSAAPAESGNQLSLSSANKFTLLVTVKNEFGIAFTDNDMIGQFDPDATVGTVTGQRKSTNDKIGYPVPVGRAADTCTVTNVGDSGYLAYESDNVSIPATEAGSQISADSANKFTILVNLTNEFGTAVTGGGNETAIFTSLFTPTSTWTQATSSAQWLARYSYTSLVYDNKMWVMGGVDGGRKNDVWYSTDGIAWVQATSSAQWSARDRHTSLVHDNKMWVIGGWDGAPNYKNDVWYSTDGITWTQAISSAQWSARDRHTSVVYDNKMWVMGGVDGTGRKNDVWYSTDGITWVQATSSAQWSTRYSHTSLVYDDKMWVIGGKTFPLSYENDVWYSADGITWTQATSSAQWSGRYAHTSLVYDNKMWVIGGWASSPNYKNDVWYSTDGITWTQATSSAQWSARYLHTSLVYDNKMWVIGGNDGTYKNDVWHLPTSFTDSEKSDNTQIGIPVPVGIGIGSVRVAGLGEEGYVRNELSSVSIPASEADSQTTINSANQFTVLVNLTNEFGTAVTGGGNETAVFAPNTTGVTWTQATSSAQWSARYNHASLVYDNKMWVIGGHLGGFPGTYKNDVWYSTDGITWTQATSSAQWSARRTHTSLVYNGEMWVMGGEDSAGFENGVWHSTDGITWTQATSSAQWSARRTHTSLVYNNKMWVMGGYDGSDNKNDVWHSTDGITWTQATSSAQWSARDGHTSLVYDNKMWVMGGYDNKNDVWYSTDGITWTQATSSAQWSGRVDHTSLVYDNKMWVIGGSMEVCPPLQVCESYYKNDVWYSTDGITWTQATSSAQWSARNNHTSVAYDSKMWVMGGEDDSGYKNDVWYSPSYTGTEKSDNTKIGILVPVGTAANTVKVAGLGEEGYMNTDVTSVSVPTAETGSQATVNSANKFTVLVTFKDESGATITGDGDEAASWDNYPTEEKSDYTQIGIKVPTGTAASNVTVFGLYDQGYLDYTIINSSPAPAEDGDQLNLSSFHRRIQRIPGGGAIVTAPVTATGLVTATAVGGKTTVTTGEGTKASVELPANAVSKATDVKIDPVAKATVTVTVPVPVRKGIPGSYAYNYTATSEGKAVTTFAKTLTLTFTYTDAQIANLNEATLKAYYWDADAAEWTVLPSTLDTTVNKVTAKTNHFTYFTLMGDLIEEEVLEKPIEEIIEEAPAIVYEGIPAEFTFEKKLKYGDENNDVKYLQIILKTETPETYPADVPATGWFGPITKASVIAFQEKYAEDVLTPWGLTEGTGYVGSTTRAKLNSLLATVPIEEKEVTPEISEIPADYKFTTDLKYDQTSDDVRYLQMFLEAQGSEIYPEGIVSGWFGPLTGKAVIRFQEKHASDILAPWELTEGTGFVGKTTRAKINEILGR